VTPTAIEWPKITVGGVKGRFTLRYAYSADYQLARWGKNLASANSMELAAAMCGTFDQDGAWHSAGFERAVDLADLMLPAEERPVVEAVAVAVKNRYPELEVKAQPIPGNETAQSIPANDASNSGPSPSPDPASGSVIATSGA
jgi:hypothetical protein